MNCVYRDDFARLLRDQTDDVAEKTQRQWRSRAMKSSSQASNTPRSDHDNVSGTRLSRFLIPSIAGLAINRFFFDFVVPLDEIPDFRGATSNGSYFAFVPTAYSNADAGSCVALALSAAANANFGRRCKSSQALDQSLRDYGNALRKMREAVQAPGSEVSSDTLAAACLLGAHELSATSVAGRRSWGAHVTGAAALLRTKFEAKHQVRETAADICADWRGTQTAYGNDKEQIFTDAVDIIARGQALYEEMTEWRSGIPEVREIQRLENCDGNVPAWLRPVYGSPGAPKMLQKYGTIHISHRLQFWRASRLTLLSTVVSAICTLLSFAENRSDRDRYEPIKTMLEQRVLDLIDDICEGVFTAFTVPISGKPEPQSLSDVLSLRGYQLLWPLQAAAMCLKRMDLHQQETRSKLEWICSMLSHLRDDLGLQTGTS